ncbi:MAG: basic amino acid ABC transporter substrate-binding protein [Lachnospiraceae bacterium]|nr:basic amino acid ABC transporter substrate-binding protein [Lachnospiraceae bacterium]
MKKSVIVLLAVTMMICLSACGGASSQKLVMATNAAFPPYESVDGSEIIGIDPEIAKLIADDLGRELVIEDMAFDSIIAAVQSGKADIAMAGLTVTEDRKQNINFSDPYTEAAQVIVVKKDSTVTCPDDLEGKTIGVQIGTTGDIYAGDIADAVIERYSKYFEAINALNQDKIDAVIVDREPAKVFVNDSDELKMIDEEFTLEEYAIGVAKENTELLDQINASLKKLQDSGKIDEIINKYIKAE